MKRIVPWACVVGLAVFPAVGCSDTSGSENTGGTPGTGGTGGTAGDGGSGGSVPDFATLFLTVGDGEGGVLEGAWFCESDAKDNCSTTNAEGRATIDVEVPADQRIMYTYGKDGWLSLLRTDMVDEMFTGNYRHFTLPDAWMAGEAERLGFPWPLEGTGVVEVATGVAGAVLELVPSSGAETRYYRDEDGVAHLELEATTSDGVGGFIEVEPGMVEVRISGSATNCAAGWGWPGSEPSTVQIPVRDNYVSWSSMLCEEQ